MSESLSSQPEPQAWHAPFNPWIIAVVVTLATFMEVLDTSIANVALPHIAGSLGAGINDATWVLTSYLVSNAVMLPVSGWIVSLIGRRKFYLASVALFTGSSFLCGLAPNLPTLVFFRLVQGIGGGGLQPSTQAILVDTFPPKRRGMGLAVYGMTVVAAPVIGPTLGGWITDNASWRWIFFINIPVGILALALSSHFVTDPPYLVRRRVSEGLRIDWMGLGAIALGVGCMQMALDIGERHDWLASNLIIGLVVVAVASLLFTLRHELVHPQPIINLRLLAESSFAVSIATMFLFGFVLYGSTVLLPLFMQTLLGYPAFQSGLAVSPGALAIMVLMPVVGWMVGHLDSRRMIAFGAVIVPYALWKMSHFTLGVDFTSIVTARVIQGVGLAFIFVPLTTVAYSAIDPRDRNAASSLITFVRNVGASVGISSMTSLVTRRTQMHHAVLANHVSPLNTTYHVWVNTMTSFLAGFVPDHRMASQQTHDLLSKMVNAQARALAFDDAFALLAVMFLGIVPLAMFMRRTVARPEAQR